VKRQARVIAAVAITLIGARFLDLFWLVRPAFENGVSVHWLDPAAAIAIGGLWMWTFVWQLKTRPLVPLNDPYLPEAR
jgi:hypothetical protein